MKSYFLEGVKSEEDARKALCQLYPGQEQPWIIRADNEDAIAYFSIVEKNTEMVVPAIQVDISGRHYDKDKVVLDALRTLSDLIGGNISDDSM